jgi:hypothetical protein
MVWQGCSYFCISSVEAYSTELDEGVEGACVDQSKYAGVMLSHAQLSPLHPHANACSVTHQ